jgi:hypothetical protein
MLTTLLRVHSSWPRCDLLPRRGVDEWTARLARTYEKFIDLRSDDEIRTLIRPRAVPVLLALDALEIVTNE